MLLLADRFSSGLSTPSINQALRLSVSVVLVGTGGWFALIGVGFFLYGDHGVFGYEKGKEPGHGALSLILTVIFMVTMVLVTGAWVIAERLLSPKSPEDGSPVELQSIMGSSSTGRDKTYERVRSVTQDEDQEDQEVIEVA